MKKIYSCNICREEIENIVESFGVCFSNMKKFTLGGHASTEGIHICYDCARQLQEHLNHDEIKKLLKR